MKALLNISLIEVASELRLLSTDRETKASVLMRNGKCYITSESYETFVSRLEILLRKGRSTHIEIESSSVG